MSRSKISPTAAVVIACLDLAATRSAAEADEALPDALPANGGMTREQHEHLPEEKDVEGATVTLDSRGLNLRSADDDFAMRIGARLHFEAARHRGDDNTGLNAVDGTELRRARIELSGTFHRDWRWAAETDFADNDTAIKDFWLRYTGFGNVDLTFGHQKQPYSLDIEMSSNDMPFIERSIDAYLITPFIDRAIGIRMDMTGERWFGAAGIYGEAAAPGGMFGESEGLDPFLAGDEGWGTTGRFVFAPTVQDDRVLHLGIRAAYREPADNPDPFRTLRIRDETTHFSNLRIVDTGILDNIENVSLFGPEGAWVHGPFSVYGEYNDARISRSGGAPRLSFESWHIAATWSLTGESRAAAYRLDAGEFKRLSPGRTFRRGGEGRGAWELALRYASLDLNDGSFVGGSEETLSASANWYVNENVRMLFDWTHIVDTDQSNQVRIGAEGMDILRARVQFTF